MIESSKGGQATDVDSVSVFPLPALGVYVGTKDTIEGYVVLGRRGGLL